ncbi:Rha family transcriptional regulator [Clostridium tetani]|uniref:Rha family transcriptional regulator n=1 Tax=Clostridium tetani TaxID=1513 RepID=UPI002953408B|nr:Rha family transcriptional regulator [Clostridium tetani]
MVKRLKNMKESKMLRRQLLSYILTLKSKKMASSTIKRKMTDIMEFLFYLDGFRESGNEVTWHNINDIVFTYVRDGYFTTEDLDGSYGYRRSIYTNIRQGMNYIYEDMQDGEIVAELDAEQKELLEEISKNNWFRCSGNKNTGDVNNSIQTQLIEKLGLKVYFDEDNKPYVLSTDLAEMIGKNHFDVLKKFREIKDNLDESKKSFVGKTTDFTMVEDFYNVEKKVGNNIGYEKRTTYRLYKDLLFLYVLGLNGQKYFEFKVNYIDAFNFIEEEYNRILEKHARLKQSFLKMYNTIRKENRDLLLKR